MKHASTAAAIEAAEMKMEASRRRTREGLHRVNLAFRETVSRPSTLIAAGGIAGLAGLAGFLLARRPHPRVRYAPSGRYAKAGTGVVVASSLAAVGRFLLSRYGVRGLTLVVRQLRKSWEQRNPARNAARAAHYGAGAAERDAAAMPASSHYPAPPPH